jgi:site-specific recombinase XerD
MTLAKVYSTSTINARLAAARKLLRAVADDTTDIHVKLVLTSWAGVEDAKATIQQDKTETDYGRRLTLESLRDLVNGIDITTLKGLRDRALIAVMAGAGLRVSEVTALTLRDVFLTQNEAGQRAVRVRHGKPNKSRAGRQWLEQLGRWCGPSKPTLML